jgi:hypothetical protein
VGSGTLLQRGRLVCLDVDGGSLGVVRRLTDVMCGHFVRGSLNYIRATTGTQAEQGGQAQPKVRYMTLVREILIDRLQGKLVRACFGL